MDSNAKLQATKTVWITLGIVLFALFVSASIMETLTTGHVILGVAAMIAGMGSTSFIWTSAATTSSTQDQEKVKRQAIDDVLRDLSDKDLERLKRRLQDGTIDDDVLYDQMAIGDDGELVYRD